MFLHSIFISCCVFALSRCSTTATTIICKSVKCVNFPFGLKHRNVGVGKKRKPIQKKMTTKESDPIGLILHLAILKEHTQTHTHKKLIQFDPTVCFIWNIMSLLLLHSVLYLYAHFRCIFFSFLSWRREVYIWNVFIHFKAP